MKQLIYICILSVLTSTFTACNKLVEGLNDNPNQPSETSPDLLLTGLQLGAVTLHMGEMSRDAGLLNGYYRGVNRQYLAMDNYMIINADFNGHWADAYRVIRNAVILDELAAAENREGIIVGISKVMAAHTFGTITALWGDVPFQEAGQYDEYNNPSYDPQGEVYAGIQAMLDQAITALESPIGRPVSNADLFFDGDPQQWLKVAHTLKARFYLHVGDYEKAYEQAMLGMNAASDTWKADFFMTELQTENLYEQFFRGNRAEDLESNGGYFVDLLSPTGSAYRGNAKTNETARFNYLVNTVGTRSINNTTADGAFGATAPYNLLTYEENLLILAESAFHVEGFDKALTYLNTLRAYYDTGAHIGTAYRNATQYEYAPYVAADFETGGMASVNGLTRDQALLREILEEKYILFYASVEGFIDMRRTQSESYALPIPPNTGDQLPARFLYPQTELDRNINIPSHVPNLYDKTPINQ